MSLRAPRRLFITASLAAWRRMRPAARRRHPRGLMLADGSRETVLLVWALDLTDSAAALAGVAGILALFDRVVLVTDDWRQGVHPPFGREVVVLPAPSVRARRAPELDWAIWMERRQAQLRHDWSPDFEITLGAGQIQLVPSG